jgi:hypothetical protein
MILDFLEPIETILVPSKQWRTCLEFCRAQVSLTPDFNRQTNAPDFVAVPKLHLFQPLGFLLSKSSFPRLL